MRSPYQVLVLPFHQSADGTWQFCLFQRKDSGAWQGIAGGGEAEESSLQTAQREAYEEAGIPIETEMISLTSIGSVPAEAIGRNYWGNELVSIPEYAFGVEVSSPQMSISHEHQQYIWLPYEEARRQLTWESNKIALWELNQLLTEKKSPRL